MKSSRTLAGLSGLAVLATAMVGLVPVPSTAAPLPAATSLAASDDAAKGRGAVTDYSVALKSTARVARAATDVPGYDDELVMPDKYPFQPELQIFPENAGDATATANGKLIAYHDIAPKLMDWMNASNRISTQVVGRSSAGRDLYLVTVTAPETVAQTAQQQAWKDEVREDPTAAAADTALQAGYKTPIWFSANIHGNEWEGTDASMQVIEDLVTAPWDEVKDVIRSHRLYFTVTINPDGRSIGQRPGVLNLDINRDMVTQSTPESVAFAKSAAAIQPLYSADLHGYTSVLQVEPCGPPHGENYEYDLFIPHGYAIARKVEDDVVNAAIPGNTYLNTTTGQVVNANTGPETAHIKIPYRDTPSGWDDYPPIFTAQYAAFHGAVTSTVELPKGRVTIGGQSRQNETNAVINTAVAKQTIESMIDYVDANNGAMLLNQMEIFRRGVAGEPKTSLTTATIADVPGPSEWKSLWDVVDDQDPVTLPRAYVIPVGDDQRSASDAERLVEQLLFHDIEVGTLDADTTVAGTTYPAGSYVVDLHQPLRGLANSLLDLGTDISLKVPSMYDISAWSLSYLWGATVDKVGLTTDAPLGATTAIDAPVPDASVPSARDYTAFEVAGVTDYQALNALLEDEVEVSLLDDGTAVVGPDDFAAVGDVSDEFDIDVESASAEQLSALADPTTKALTDLTIGYTGSQDDKVSLLELGFDDLVPVTSAGLTATPAQLDSIDVLWLGAALTFSGAQTAGRDAVQAWVDAGHSVIGRGTAGLNAAQLFGLLSATAQSGNGSGNAIVALDTPSTGVLSNFAQAASFIYPAVTFLNLGPTTVVEQSYDAVDPVLAGHWRATTATNGPDAAAGKAAVISGVAASGAKGFVFGTSPLYRNMVKGGLSQVAQALFWGAPVGTPVVAPAATTTTTVTNSPATYPNDASVVVTVASASGTPTGSVELLAQPGGASLGTAPLVAGSATVTVPDLPVGTTSVVATYTPDDVVFLPSSSAPFDLVVESTNTTVTATATSPVAYPKKPVVTVAVAAEGATPTGTVEVVEVGSSTALASATLVDGAAKITMPVVKPGTASYTVRYVPDAPGFDPSSSAAVPVKVTKAVSTTGLTFQRLGNGKVKAVFRLKIADLPDNGTVVLRDNGKVIRTVTVPASGVKTLTVKLAKGTHVLRAITRATSLVLASSSAQRTVRIK